MKSVWGAVGGAVLGILIWVSVALAFHWEWTGTAVLVGILIGFGTRKFGGRGSDNAWMCVGIAVAAIFLAKIVSIWLLIPIIMREQLGGEQLQLPAPSLSMVFELMSETWTGLDMICLFLAAGAAYFGGLNPLADQDEPIATAG